MSQLTVCSDAKICNFLNFRHIHFKMNGVKRSLSGKRKVSECKRLCTIENNVQSPQVNIRHWFRINLIVKVKRFCYIGVNSPQKS